ncbi:MAG: transketolase, partial [Crocinitomicaceae bacterium]|nr:transketolase [Crocinitomicaceae bacterium]
KECLHFPIDKTFYVDQEVIDFFKEVKESKLKIYDEIIKNKVTNDVVNIESYEEVLEELTKIRNSEKSCATRESSSQVLKTIAKMCKNIIVGSADLAESNKTLVSSDFISKNSFDAKYLHYGIREHAMCSIANGISTYNVLPIVSTFLVFITYCLAPIRMAALSKHKVLYVFTHDSVFLGEDGPTHQPVESLTILRSIPNLLTIRPCDVTEVSGAYQIALKNDGPTALIFSRQTIENCKDSCSSKMEKGAYIVYEPLLNDIKELKLIIVATGSEVPLAIEYAKTRKDVRVVSMPCSQLFDKQDAFYKEEILPTRVKKMSLEAGSTMSWYKYVDYAYGIDTFGESGKMSDLV